MCGVFGFIRTENSEITGRFMRSLARELMLLSETRGKDASGIAIIDKQEIKIFKRPVRAKNLVRRDDFRSVFEMSAEQGRDDLTLFMGHARMVTNGAPESHENNQPVVKDGMICIQNGIVVNDQQLWRQFPDLTRQYEVDTEIILSLVRHYRQQDLSLLDAVIATFAHLRGANTIALMANDANILVLATTNGSLYMAKSKSNREIIFASEKTILKNITRHSLVASYFRGEEITQVQAGQGYAIQLPHGEIYPFQLYGKTETKFSALPDDKVHRSIVDVAVRENEKKDYHNPYLTIITKNASTSEKLLQIDFNKIASLRRCKTCILPETFPFIEFDEQGQCSICNGYHKLVYKGDDELRRLVEPYQNNISKPDCLVPVSGGRDSSFGLHYIKQELGLNPVAFTYDWGMVTDLARRNISRMCGQLGVEHILISADIRRKRENIRKNVLAWLQQPSLGTVPLFMAGDKQFFYYANMLKKQMGLGIVLFSMNPLERTDFKVAFSGIREEKKMEKHFDLNTSDQYRLMLYYSSQFIKNRKYINDSLMDTLFGFISYYMIPKDYKILYEYIPWVEQKIEDVLIKEYDWEIAQDTPTTWRIGDGTASFYNYIYCRVAGFSEIDTFRSNQVRMGLISRDKALSLSTLENQPRFDAIQWYCNTIGVDMEMALKKINAIPTLY